MAANLLAWMVLYGADYCKWQYSILQWWKCLKAACLGIIGADTCLFLYSSFQSTWRSTHKKSGCCSQNCCWKKIWGWSVKKEKVKGRKGFRLWPWEILGNFNNCKYVIFLIQLLIFTFLRFPETCVLKIRYTHNSKTILDILKKFWDKICNCCGYNLKFCNLNYLH